MSPDIPYPNNSSYNKSSYTWQLYVLKNTDTHTDFCFPLQDEKAK